MPRTAKSKAKNKNVAAKSCDALKHTTRKPKNDRKEVCIKNGLVVETPKETIVEEVYHRKSERRRVARDIFLVFEEEPTCRRKTRSNKKQTKPKFGHLKVEDPIRPKGLLRDIKNEPKCFSTSSAIDVKITSPTDATNKKKCNLNSLKKEYKNVKSEKSSSNKTLNSCLNKSNNIKSLKISTLNSQSCTYDGEPNFVARVNPIFLWVKQDNTRIVEVRCEDYDKRNRIRIKKTSNGWRAIPRSDPTTSRILKFYPTPLMKVKRESIHETNSISNKTEQDIEACKDFSSPNKYPEFVATEIETKLNGTDTVCNPLAIKNILGKCIKKSKKLKKKSRVDKTDKKVKPSTTATIEGTVNDVSLPTLLNPPFNTNFSDFPLQISAGLESIELPPENIPIFNFENSTNNMQVKTNSSLTIVIPSKPKSTYQKESEKELFHLCPKTGFFLPNHISVTEYENESNEKIDEQNTLRTGKNCFLISSKEEFNSDMDKINTECKMQIAEEITESLEAKTKNLKDLLDDADLLQNCDDNANSDADLIDTLVKNSCENNLIQANEIITKANVDQLNQKALHGTNEMVVQLIADVSDPPKCLSFNEAGEIEGLNGELFQSNTYIEAFDKQPSAMQTESQVMLHSTTSVVEETAICQERPPCELTEPIASEIDVNNSNLQLNDFEDSPKDLSYKKREEVCPPSESRSQCAVTSSSDVVKSPAQEESSLTSSTETIKNLILEQFLKLNALTTQHQREPIDLETQRQSEISNVESLYASKSAQSSNFIETVVIEDDENGSDIGHEEPLKKRSRLNKRKLVTQNVGKLAMIDGDPDPLTQLRLLIRNTQWKVPDPILVPKDRLSAVLASPAREIPLLITTRPELRLPEAFAYPEIIQNPNILVISMAQLEAILKNELEVEERSISKAMKPDVSQQFSINQVEAELNRIEDLELQSPEEHLYNTSKQLKNVFSTTSIQAPNNKSIGSTDISGSLSEIRHGNSKNPPTDSTISDINSTTMAVLNQMLWLPYFGQLSQDIGKSTKNPISLQEICPNMVPFFNSQLNGINLEEFFRSTENKKICSKPASNSGIQNFHEQHFSSKEDLSLFQKIVQHQMQSVLQLNQHKVDSAVVADNKVIAIDKSKSKIDSSSNLVEQRKQKSNNRQAHTSLNKIQTNNSNNNILVQEKSYNLRSSVAGRHTAESKQYLNYNQRQVTDNKPRLTCKSLSNLLDPEHSMLPSPSSSCIPLVQNLSSDILKNVNEIKRNSTECRVKVNNAEAKRQMSCNAPIAPASHTSYNNMNISIESNSELNKRKPKAHENHQSNNDTPGLTTETNVPLWHPLFGSNTKTAYSSPWQWTTVTATGE